MKEGHGKRYSKGYRLWSASGVPWSKRFWDCGDNGAKNYANIFPPNEVDEI